MALDTAQKPAGMSCAFVVTALPVSPTFCSPPNTELCLACDLLRFNRTQASEHDLIHPRLRSATKDGARDPLPIPSFSRANGEIIAHALLYSASRMASTRELGSIVIPPASHPYLSFISAFP